MTIVFFLSVITKVWQMLKVCKFFWAYFSYMPHYFLYQEISGSNRIGKKSKF